MQAVSAGQMAALPLQMLLGAAAVAAGLNTVHWRQMPDPSPASARQLRQWLWFIGCINCGLLLQVCGTTDTPAHPTSTPSNSPCRPAGAHDQSSLSP